MSTSHPDIVVLRKGTEGLSPVPYAELLEERLSEYDIELARTAHQERELIGGARVATGISISEELVEQADDLELFVTASSGYNHLPLEKLSEQGVAISNASGIHAPGIAEQALGFCLSFARQINEGWLRKQNSQWRHYKATEFTGSTVTIVGLGAIGQAFVQRLRGMEVDTIGVRYTPEKGGPTDEVIGFDERTFHEALSRTDYLVLCTPLSETTSKLIGEDELTTLPPHAILVNVCRGGVVDTDALLRGLQNEIIAGAAMDVTDPEPLPVDHPLWNLDNVMITPHMGGHTPKHWDRLADILVENVRKMDRGEYDDLRNLVNGHALSQVGTKNPTSATEGGQ